MRCPGCGIDPPPADGPTHAYMTSSPACWAMFGEVLAREYENAAFWRAHQNTVDAYAVQHPGGGDRRAVQSVNLHLASLYLRLELGCGAAAAKRVKAALSKDRKGAFEPLTPPAESWPVTIADIHATMTSDEHVAMAERWARAAWDGMRPHHQLIKGMIEPYV